VFIIVSISYKETLGVMDRDVDSVTDLTVPIPRAYSAPVESMTYQKLSDFGYSNKYPDGGALTLDTCPALIPPAIRLPPVDHQSLGFQTG
jgi:hypothetical protein